MQAETEATACPHCGSSISKHVTSRQLEVIDRLAQGDDFKTAAVKLNISPKTVEKHVQAAKRCLGAKTLSHLMIAAVKSGLITA